MIPNILTPNTLMPNMMDSSSTPQMVIPKISLVVLSYNNWDFTYTCLTSLIESFDESLLERRIEVIVVDNGSTHENRQYLEAFAGSHLHPYIELRLVLLEENLGYPGGINVGLEHCLGDVIGVLNNDLVFPFGWLAPLIQALEDDKLIGFAAPFLSYSPGIQHIDKTFVSFAEMQQFATNFTNSNTGQVMFTDRVTGACLLFRRDLLASIGGNDFWYGIGNYDDTDWCTRARIAGYKVAVVGSSFVQHKGHATFHLEPTRFNSSLKANLEKFQRKWKTHSHAEPDGANILNEIVKHTTFGRGHHYIPFRFSDFSSPQPPLLDRSFPTRKCLLCADWNSDQSEWTQAVISFLLENEQAELIFWIPKSLFDVKSIAAEIQRIVASSQINIKAKDISLRIFQDDVPYVDIPKLLSSADAVVKVPGDFVNRYILRLGKQIGVDVML